MPRDTKGKKRTAKTQVSHTPKNPRSGPSAKKKAVPDEAEVSPTNEASPAQSLDNSRLEEVTATVVSSVTAQIQQAVRAELGKLLEGTASTSVPSSDVTPLSLTPTTGASNKTHSPAGFGQGPSLASAALASGAPAGHGQGPSLAGAITDAGGTPEMGSLSGGFSNTVGPAPFSAPLPLDFAVSQDLRNKIWNNEFVDLGDLLHPVQAKQTKLALQKDENGDDAICFVNGAKKAPRSINEWSSAFAIFTAVYTSKFPSEVAKLLKYSEVVRQIASEGGNFNLYDMTFRKLRQTIELAFDQFHTELYLKALQAGPLVTSGVGNNAPRKSVFRSTNSSLPIGYCFRFIRGQYCDGQCGFKHTCHKCSGNHSPARCWQVRHQSFAGRAPGRGSFDKSTIASVGQQQSKFANNGTREIQSRGGTSRGRGQLTHGRTYNSSK